VAALASTSVDRNLLFAVIALQDDLIDQTQFADVCAGWAMQLARPLSDLLIERGWITAEDKREVERKLERKLKKHGGDARLTLGAVADINARDALQAIEKPEIRQSLAALPPARGHVLVETLVPPANQRDTLRYTLTRVHAEGGLGKIWIAHDTDLNRDVALKEIKTAAAPTQDAWHRFLKEAQITGQLEHPNIVPVYELARRKEDDQPFYTMRFLRGQTLREAAGEFHRRRAGKPPDRLELQRQLLEPFVKVCQAVGYAHSRGVIHRDLKPENVILGAYGEVVVLDWGLAKIVGQAEPSSEDSQEPRISLSAEADAIKTHGQIGTPAYMAPEQVEGRAGVVDTRTDVYGLGTILFEVLTGRPPATGSSIAEVFRQIQSGNLRKAREIEPTVPPPLEAICAKALEHDRRNRYRTAEELAEDVRRWLLDEPVSVYRDSVAVRILRWGRRHRTLAASVAALLVTAVVALSVGVFLIDRERAQTEKQRQIADEQRQIANANADKAGQERRIADEQRQLATANAAQAIHNLRLAQNAADSLLGEVADVDLAEIPQMEPVRVRLLQKAERDFAQFLVQEGGDPRVRWGAARAQVRLADIQALLGDAVKAEKAYREAARELDDLIKGDASNVDFQRDKARADHGLGVLLKDASRFKEGEVLLRAAIGLRQPIARKADATGLDQQALADSQYQLGALLARQGTTKPGDMTAYQDAINVQEELIRQRGETRETRAQLARYRNNLGMLQNASGQSRDAEATFQGILEMLDPLIQGPDPLPAARWQFARAANNFANVLLEKKQREQAAVALLRAQGLLRKLKSEFSEVAQYAMELATVENTLGRLAAQTKKPRDTVAAFRESVRLLESLRSRFPAAPAYRLRLAISLVSLNEALIAEAPAEAEAGLKRAIDDLDALVTQYPGVPEYERALGRAHYQLARVLLVRKHGPEALIQAGSARKLQQQVKTAYPDSDRDSGALAETQALITLALIDIGRLAEAAAAAVQIQVIRPVDPSAHLTTASLLIHCAEKAVHTADGLPFAANCLNRAVETLSDGVRDKIIRFRSMLNIDELRALHDRDDFKKLRDSIRDPVRPG
jgi:serine/threonine protein kinase